METAIATAPDIQYLLWLQNFRNSINNAWSPFMEWVSMFATTYLILFAVFYYWNRDKRDGLTTLLAYYFCMFLTPVIKLSVCAYRPWIRDSRVLPAGDAIRTATGYSFPSGHTTTAGPLAGGLALATWKEKKLRWCSVIFLLFILLTGFSRNYLGVHTPQDVFVALCITVLTLIAAVKIVAWVVAHPEKEDLLLLCGLGLCACALVYITFKGYPMDYNEEGKLIVDPQKMMNDGYGDLGKVVGFILARLVEKHWIRFKPLKQGAKSIVICLIGLIPMVLMKKYFQPVLTGWLGSHWGKLLFSVLYTSYYIALFPLVLKWVGNMEKKQEQEQPQPQEQPQAD